MKEQWKHVVDWPEYQISNLGNVMGKTKILNPWTNNKGYLNFDVHRKGKNRCLRVHRETLRAFVGIRDGMLALHNDGDKTNCKLSNLRWGTAQDNADDAVRHGNIVRGENHRSNKLTESQVRSIRQSSLKYKDIAKKFGIAFITVSEIKRRVTWRWLSD